MNNSKIKMWISIFMIWLIISLPFAVGVVYGSINTINAYGNDNVDGYAKDYDTLTVKANVQISEESMNASKIKVGSVAFNSCASSTMGGYDCMFSYILDAVNDVNSFSVNLYSDSSSLLDARNFDIKKDSVKPAVILTSSDSFVGNNKNITATYAITETDNEGSECSGIKTIKVYKNDISSTPFKIIPVTTTDCYQSGTFVFNSNEISSATTGTETVIVYIEAEDKMGNYEVAGVNIEIDHNAPVINTNSAKLFYSGDNELKYFADRDIDARFYIQVSSDSIASMEANISGNLNDMQCVYSTTLSLYECNLDVVIDSSTFTAELIAIDNAENEEKVTITKILTMDTTGPNIDYFGLEPSHVYNGVNYIKSTGNKIIARLSENGVGLYNNNIYLDASELGAGSNIQANCTKQTDWNCEWYNVNTNNPNEDRVFGRITTDSADDLVNTVTGNLTAIFEVDNSIPIKVGEISVSGKGQNIAKNYEGIIKSNDWLDLKINIMDKTPVKVFANLSGFGINTLEPMTCNYDDLDNQSCTVVSPEVASGPYTGTVIIVAEDVAGNINTFTTTADVYGISGEQNPNYWDVKLVECSPSLIDRELTPYVQQKVYCHLKLEPIAQLNISTLAISVGRCSGNTTYVVNPNLLIMNNGPGSLEPYVRFELATSAMTFDKIDLVCPILTATRFTSSQGKTNITGYEEVDNATLSVSFYNNPLGEYGNNIQSKIDAVKSNALVSMEWIGSLQKLISMLEKICKLIDFIGGIANMFHVLSAGLSSFQYIPATSGIAYAADKVSDGTHATWLTSINSFTKFCAYISCDKSLWKDNYDKIISQQSAEGTLGYNLKTKYGFEQATMWPQSPKDSLVLSTVSMCIPGILYNLQKMRQIQCQYGICLRDSIPMHLPIKYCEDTKSYLTCQFVFGEIFQVIPYANFIKQLGGYIKSILSNPISMIFAGSEYLCNTNPDLRTKAFCKIYAITREISKMASQVKALSDTKNWVLDKDLCEELMSDGEE